jgi:hypothetical protein
MAVFSFLQGFGQSRAALSDRRSGRAVFYIVAERAVNKPTKKAIQSALAVNLSHFGAF